MPLTVVGTGVGRYLRGLYSALEAEWSDSFEVSYFTGKGIVSTMPDPVGPGWKERVGQLLWKMPTPIAFGARMMQHASLERSFARINPGYDIYHEAGYFPFQAKRAKRTVMTIHDLSLLLHPSWHPRERVRYWQHFFHDRVPSVGAFCAVSEFTKQEMVDHLYIDPALITVTHLGVDETLFNDGDDLEAQAFLEKAGLPEDFLLFVGSGDPRKNLDKAIAAIGLSHVNLPLVVVGWTGWNSVQGTNVVGLGFLSDRVLAQVYRRATMLVMPSEYEGFGLPVVEAMACGCPVLASRAGALEEVGGQAVASVDDTHDLRGFADKIDETVLSIERLSELAGKGKKRSVSFSWRRTASLTMGKCIEENAV
nr:glycosyltransferase family 1 protein [Pseudodesulfovibrio sp. JC047]